MIAENIVPQSAGSLSVAILSLIMTVLQMILFLKKPKFKWFGWSAAVSFSSMVYAAGIFFEYNTLGPVNRFAGLLEFTAIIFLVHCLYGFTFTYLGMNSKRYHIAAGIFHCLILIILWSGDYIVSYEFTARNFIGLARPFIEADVEPAGFLFELYMAMSCVVAIAIWLNRKGPVPRYRSHFLTGMIFWVVLGIHDGLASMGVPSFQYLMEYGFLGFSIVILWVVFDSFVDISAEDKYRVITEYVNDCILVIQDEKIVFANSACDALIGPVAADPSFKDILDVVIQEDREKFIRHYNDLLQKVDSPGSLIVRIKRFHEQKIVEARESLISYRNRPAVLSIIRDITEKVREEEALKESEEKIARLKKMESLGLLAGGVAHDLNNVLSGIVSYPELILLDLPEDSPLRKPVQTMQESGKMAAAIVQDLLTTARGVAIPKEPLNFNNVIRGYFRTPEYEKLLEYHPAVLIKSDLASDLMNIKGSSVHIGKVVMNLLSNACEAIDGSGNVVIATMNRYLDRPLKGYNDVNIGEYAVLSVADNGPGIPQDDLKRIFEPFFTKKLMGRSGTGLGLTVVWNVVQDHNGYIDITSGNGGTKFDLYFPITRDAILDRNLIILAEKLYGNGETILVVDDVKSQRDILCHMLERLKYKTKSVASGEEAVDYLKDHSADLLVLDMIMDPGINGRVTYERIKRIHPEQKAVIVSGFAETDDVKATLNMGAGRFLKKPLILTELGLAVKVELGK